MGDEVQVQRAKDEQEETFDTSDQSQVNKARKKAARTRADRLEFVKASMSFSQGRAWFYDHLVRAHVFRSPYITGDTHGTSFRCGEQNLGYQILDDIQVAAPEEYILMIKENK